MDTAEQAKIDLAYAFRLAAHFGYHESICNHFSCIVPGHSDRFFLNPQGLHWSEIQPEHLLTLDSGGQIIEGNGSPESTALYIHWQIHKARPDKPCALHTHMPYATTLACLAEFELEPISQSALMFYDRVAYDRDYNGLATSEVEGQRIAATLGDKDVVFLANHGVIVLGQTVAHAFNDLYFLERACRLQVQAMATGAKRQLISETIARKTAEQHDRQEHHEQVRLHFDALKRILRS